MGHTRRTGASPTRTRSGRDTSRRTAASCIHPPSPSPVPLPVLPSTRAQLYPVAPSSTKLRCEISKIVQLNLQAENFAVKHQNSTSANSSRNTLSRKLCCQMFKTVQLQLPMQETSLSNAKIIQLHIQAENFDLSDCAH